MNDDRFAEFLDAMVSGTAPADATPPADIAKRIQQATSERLDGERRAAIWSDLISAHGGGTRTSGGPGPLNQPALSAPDAFNPWVRRHRPSLPRGPRMGIVHEAMQTGITAMAIVAVVIAAFIAFPIIRGDEATPRVTPTAWAAAPTLEEVNPASTPMEDCGEPTPNPPLAQAGENDPSATVDAPMCEQDDSGDPESGNLPVHWGYVWSEASGEWLLDSYGP